MGNAKIERQYMGKMTPFRLAAPSAYGRSA
mgnify:CR=1 FL=1